METEFGTFQLQKSIRNCGKREATFTRVRGSASLFILASVLFVLGARVRCSCLKRTSTTELIGTFGRTITGGVFVQSVRQRGE